LLEEERRLEDENHRHGPRGKKGQPKVVDENSKRGYVWYPIYKREGKKCPVKMRAGQTLQ